MKPKKPPREFEIDLGDSYWVSPNGEEAFVVLDSHEEYIEKHWEEMGLFQASYDAAIMDGWVRVSGWTRNRSVECGIIGYHPELVLELANWYLWEMEGKNLQGEVNYEITSTGEWATWVPEVYTQESTQFASLVEATLRCIA